MAALLYFVQQMLKKLMLVKSVSEDHFKTALHIDYSNCHLICCIAIHSALTISLAFLLIAVILSYIICIYGVTIKYLFAHEMLICRVNVRLNKVHLPEASRNTSQCFPFPPPCPFNLPLHWFYYQCFAAVSKPVSKQPSAPVCRFYVLLCER